MSKSPSQIEGSLKKQVGLHVFCANHPEFLALGCWMVQHCFNFYKLFSFFLKRNDVRGHHRWKSPGVAIAIRRLGYLSGPGEWSFLPRYINDCIRNAAHQLLVRWFLDRESEWIRCVLTKPNWGIPSPEMNKIISAEFSSENPQVLSASTAKILPYPSCWPGGFRGYGLGGNPSLDKLYLIYIARLQRCTCIICYHLAWRC